MWVNRLTQLLGIRYPIIQGALAYLSYAELAAAVSNAGGLGQLGSYAHYSGPEALREDIRKARRLTRAPFGVNFSISRNRPWQEAMDVALDEQVPVISISGGNPAPMLEYTAGKPVRKMVLVANARQALKAEELGADILVVVGTEGGGHVGVEGTTTISLVPTILDAVKVPVVAGGGIGDARGIVAALALGAEGVEMGTRFIATRESPAHDRYKQALVEAVPSETVLIERSLGRAGRVLHSPWVDKILAAEERHASLEEFLPMINGNTNKIGAWQGDFENGFVWAGQSVGVIHDIPTVAELVSRLVAEGEELTARLYRLTRPATTQ